MIVEESEFVYILNGYHGTIGNFVFYFKEAFYRLQKERAITASIYVVVKKTTGISIPKLEAFLKLNEEEEEEEEHKTVQDIKDDLVKSGAFVIV